MVKNTRDYSFLLSDDAELPAPSKGSVPHKDSALYSGALPIIANLVVYLVVQGVRRTVFIVKIYSGFLVILKMHDYLYHQAASNL